MAEGRAGHFRGDRGEPDVERGEQFQRRDGPLSYQWQENGVDLVGATGPRLILNSVKRDDSGTYRVRVSNSGGSVTSGGHVDRLYGQKVFRGELLADEGVSPN